MLQMSYTPVLKVTQTGKTESRKWGNWKTEVQRSHKQEKQNQEHEVIKNQKFKKQRLTMQQSVASRSVWMEI